MDWSRPIRKYIFLNILDIISEPLEFNCYFPIKLDSFGLSSFMFKEKHEV